MSRPRAMRTLLGLSLAVLSSGLCVSVGCDRGDSLQTDDPHADHLERAELRPRAPDAAPHGEHARAEPDRERGQKPGGAPEGYAPFSLDRETKRAIGLRTARVEERPFARTIRTTGIVVVDETRTSHVHTKVRGWVESVSVDFVGKSVARGAPLCSIYSQEVLAAQFEFLSVLEQASRAPQLSGPFAEADKRARDQLLLAARRRLALWDVPPAEIERLERTREPQRTFTLRAPRSGVVVAKQAVAGLYVDPSIELYLISDIDELWLLADIYEADAAEVRVGADAQVMIAGQPEPLSAKVAFLPPTVEETTRTLKVRFNLKNPKGRIRPGAFATVELSLSADPSLAIPEDAVIHAGPRAIAFVVSGERIEPRSLTLGPLVAGFYAVREGLDAGESVAVGAQFLIDSESRLRATSGQGPGHAGH